MWLLSFVPDSFLIWVVNIILIAGIIGFTASFFFGFVIRYLPALAPYRMIVQVVSIILLVAGVYFKGGYDVEMDWRDKVSAMEEKVKESEQRARDANAQIKTVIVQKTKVIREQQIVYQDRIREIEKKIDAECKVAPEAVDLLNQAAQGVKK